MNEVRTQSHEDLLVWQKAMDLAVTVYALTKELPIEERFGLSVQMRRCAVSIPSNIAEGKRRGTPKEFARFLRIAYGSGAELETQLELCKRLYMPAGFDGVKGVLTEVMKMTNALIQSVERP